MTAKNNDYYHLGLTDSEVLESREKNGVNLLTPPKRPSLWKLYLEKFEDPVVRVLLVAAVFSLIISIIENEYAETIGIIVAILLATGIGFFFEYDASKKFDLLNAVNEETLVKVIRNGRIQEIPRKDIVVGDIVVLETGEEIPADGELVEAISLQVNESNLTGEPVINKTIVEADFDDEATYASNMVMRGTTVVDGHGMMKVLRVGDATEIGKVARQSTEQSGEPTPLNIQLTKLAKLIGKIGFTVAGATFIIFVSKDLYHYISANELVGWHNYMAIAQIVLKYFMMAVTLIVVAVPEGLPMSVTLSLALNMRRMLSTNNLVRKMHACETMGAITVICTDKTGTLTKGEFKVAEIHSVDGDEKKQSMVLELAALAESYSDHPISRSIRDAWGKKLDQSRVSDAEEISGHGVKVKIDGKTVLAGNGKLMDKEGISYTECASVGTVVYVAEEGKFLGSIVIADGIKDGVKDAIRSLKRAGVSKTVMLTGDKRNVAEAVAKEIGLDEVHAELLPGDKVDRVEALLKALPEGRKLAFVGDGINDAPVLSRADVGIAMGSMGSDAAIEAADVVLMDDDPRKIADIVRISRKTMGIVMQNIVFALGVKFVVLAMGAFGVANMWEAVFADVGVSVIAILNAMRALRA